MEPTSSLNRGERKKGRSLVTGSEVQSQASGASCFITTDSEKSLVSRQASQVEQIELRTYVFLDSLQPQLAAYMGTVSRGFLPIPGDSCLWMEVSPGMAVHRVTDIALKASNVRLGQMIVERAFGSLAVRALIWIPSLSSPRWIAADVVAERSWRFNPPGCFTFSRAESSAACCASSTKL